MYVAIISAIITDETLLWWKTMNEEINKNKLNKLKQARSRELQEVATLGVFHERAGVKRVS